MWLDNQLPISKRIRWRRMSSPFQFLIHPKAHTNERLQVQSLLERQKRPDHRTEIFVEGAKARFPLPQPPFHACIWQVSRNACIGFLCWKKVQLELLNSVHHSSSSKLSLSLSHIHVLQVGGWVNFDILETDYAFLPSEDFTVSFGVIMLVLMLWFFCVYVL